MTKTIPGAKTRAQLEFDATASTSIRRNARVYKTVLRHRNFQEGQTTAELDPNDPWAIAWRAALEANNIPHEQVAGLGRKALKV
jgi:hypothetical protein